MTTLMGAGDAHGAYFIHDFMRRHHITGRHQQILDQDATILLPQKRHLHYVLPGRFNYR